MNGAWAWLTYATKTALHAWLQSSRASCQGPHRTQEINVPGIEVRYETLVFAGIESLPIDPPARLRCPARH
jgi:hypothetical protein